MYTKMILHCTLGFHRISAEIRNQIKYILQFLRMMDLKYTYLSYILSTKQLLYPKYSQQL